MKKTTKGALAAAAALTLSGCVLPLGLVVEDDGVVIPGSGHAVTEARAVPAFDGIVASDAVRVVARRTGRHRVLITAEDNLLPYLETRVRGGLLHVGVRDGIRLSPRRTLLVELETPALFELHASGAAVLEADLGHVSHLRSTASGAARLELQGFAEFQEAELSGAAHYRAPALASLEAHLTLSGAAEARVRVSRILEVEASGASRVWFLGSPAVYARVSGAAMVRPY